MPDRHRFGRFEIRPDERQLRLDGEPAALGARAFDVLSALVERRDRVVAKSELLELAWPGLVVEENNLQVQVSALRKLLGAGAIATIPGRGYRFTLAADEPGGAPARPAAGSAMQPAAAPPVDAPALLGREAELAALADLLGTHRLVTIVGAGGLGKTVLARTLAQDQQAVWPEGVTWVDLAVLSGDDAATQARAVALAVAHALHAPLGEGDAAALLAHSLTPRQLMLVLDNAEHLLPGATAVLPGWLAAAPGLRVLVTSQVALHLAGEQVWRLDALALPPPGADARAIADSPAVALFVQRARALDQRFALDDAGWQRAAELCRQLDGHPLAIELAAARAPQLGLVALNQRLTERLRLLQGHAPTRPTRQQSLRATLDWSCALLSPAQQVVLRRLSVFAGSFRLETAQQVVADPTLDEWAALDAIDALLDRSLLQHEAGDPPRFRLPESTRLYAAERLAAAGETAALQAAHGRVMAELALAVLDEVLEQPAAGFLASRGADPADLSDAFERACTRGDAAVAGATGQALQAFDTLRGVATLRRRRMAAALALLPAAATPIDRARLWNQAAPVSSIALPDLPRLEAARQRVAAWRAVNHRRELYVALVLLAEELARAGELEAARASAAEAAALEDPAWPPALRMVGAQVDSNIALHHPAPGPRLDGLAGLQRMLALAERSGDPARVAMARFRLADHATGEGRLDEAITLGQACVDELALARRPVVQAMALANLASAWLQAGDDARAAQALARSLPMMRPHLYAGVLFNHLALLAVRAGDGATAARLLGHADAWYRRNQSPRRQAAERRVMEPALQAIEAALGDDECRRLRDEGAALDEGQAEALAWQVLAAAGAGAGVSSEAA
jgi:predicted ATPase/DNA-binding winged helix-turn-helix (wHTH) protein